MATPTSCTIYTDRSRVLPLERSAARPALEPDLQPRLGPERQPVPRPGPPVPPAPRGRDVEPGRRRVLATSPEARPRRRRPVPRRPQLHDAARVHRRPARDHLLPGGRDRRRRAEARAGPSRPSPSCPRLEPDRDHQRRRRARAPTPSTRSGRCTWPGRSRARRSSWSRSPRRWPAPTTTASSVVRVALHVDPLDRPGQRRLRHGARRSSAASRSGCARSRSTSTSPNFTINPTNCRPFSVDSQGIGDQGTVADFSSYFQAVNCATLPFKPKMTVRQLGGRKATPRSAEPAAAVRPADPRQATPTSSRSR